MIERVREALAPESVSRRVREMLERDLRKPAHLTKLRTSLQEMADGKVRHAGEIYPER